MSPSPMAGIPSPSDSSLNGMQAATSQLPAFGAQDVRSMQRQQQESAMDQIRQVNSIVDSLASQFPAAAEEVKATKAALVKIATKIVGASTQPQSQAPTGVMG